MTLHDFPLWFERLAVVTFGLLWGSFLNVVIYRVPREMSVVHPPSHCPGCGKPVRAFDNVPILSYVILLGRARCCGAKMSPRYPAVELLGGALSLAIFEVIVRGLPRQASLGSAALVYAVDLALALALLAAAFIDAEHMILPDSITLSGIVLGVASSGLRGVGYVPSLIGAVFGFAIVYIPFCVVYRWLRGHDGMGLGDAKLLALAGAFFGWPGAVFTLFAGAMQGSVAAAAILLTRGKIDEPDAVKADREALEKAAAEGDEEAKEILAADPAFAGHDEDGKPRARIPFGPFLILAILEYLLFGDAIQSWFATFAGFG